MLEPTKVSFDELLNKISLRISSGNSMTYLRYGDGEWFSVLRTGNPINSDGNRLHGEILPELLQEPLFKPKPGIIYGIQPLAWRNMKGLVSTWLEENNVDLPWEFCDAFHMANYHGRVGELLTLLKNDREVVLFAPEPQEKLALRNSMRFERLPALDCYMQAGSIIEQVKQAAPAHVLMAGGPSTEYLLWAAHDAASSRIMIDIGSVFQQHISPTRTIYDNNWKAYL
jgi:hypothetical protein